MKISNKTINKVKVLLLLVAFTFPSYGCSKSKSTTPVVPPVVVEKDPAQYGIPFNEVPDRRDVSIYQVNIRSFSAEGNLKGVQVRLDSIKALGVNVVYLMPIYPVGVIKTVNSPYCVKDYTAVNTEFGTLSDLRNLIDAAHSRKMTVILDWVPNHTSFDNAWTSNKSWYLQDAQGNILSPPGTGWNDVAQLNFSNSKMRLAMIKAMKYWVYAANVDGFRCDYADGPPVDFWKQAIDSLRGISTHKLLLLAEGKRSANYSVGFDYNFGFEFFEKLKSIYGNNQSVMQLIDLQNETDYVGATEGQRIIRYITNHDVNSSDGTPLALFGGKDGSMAAFVVAAYMKSVPMIYNGQEVGTPYKLTFPFTSTKIDWTLNPEVTAEYKKVLAFRNGSEAIRRGTLASYSTVDVCAFTKESGNEKVLVLSNLRDKAVTYTLPAALSKSSWMDAFTGTTTTLTDEIKVEPYQYIVLKK
ncbi:MAG: alpha-glucosidase C-terminal domain-containing protein [Sphingobacteriaceae bacterium]|nr:alpha-glucosidase C-terminal domain-containing protein [Sphingobacteriaceae bacterium]